MGKETVGAVDGDTPTTDVAISDIDELRLVLVAVFALPESTRPLRVDGRVPRGVRICVLKLCPRRHGVHRPVLGGRDPEIDLLAGVGRPTRHCLVKLHRPKPRVVEEQGVAETGVGHRDGDLGVVRRQINLLAVLLVVENPGLVLPEAVEPLPVHRSKLQRRRQKPRNRNSGPSRHEAPHC